MALHHPDPTVCWLHNKKRGKSHLEETEPGRWQCMAGHECKEAQGIQTLGPDGSWQTAIPEVVVCALHDKKRFLSHTQKRTTPAGDAFHECLPQFRCKMPFQKQGLSASTTFAPADARGRGLAGYPAYSQFSAFPYGYMRGSMPVPRAESRAFSPYALVSPGPFGPMPGSQQQQHFAFCAKHGKHRSLQSLHLVNNCYQCKPGMTCKIEAVPKGEASVNGLGMGGGGLMCAVHGRLRSAVHLHRDPAAGTFSCLPGQECKLPPSEAPLHRTHFQSQPQMQALIMSHLAQGPLN
eukprot:TRINITY_DN15987_c0_g1_i1.p1 TRINITY_DN15987_c0_g1~~TRINITY_DN15987_c0_g1_i1.p1  ORF type:complete len:293 (+),score=6.01 TRINITY_DN15987_c0_g1_i1:60-938(+)